MASLILLVALRITSFGLFLIKTLSTNALRRGISYSSKALEPHYYNLGGEYLYIASIKLYSLISLTILIILMLYTQIW
jgi:hypothetical protein